MLEREKAELAAALDSDALRAIDGIVPPSEALNPSVILATRDARMRAEMAAELAALIKLRDEPVTTRDARMKLLGAVEEAQRYTWCDDETAAAIAEDAEYFFWRRAAELRKQAWL